MSGIANIARARSGDGFTKCGTWLWGVCLIPLVYGVIPDTGDFSPSAKMRVFRRKAILAKNRECSKTRFGPVVNC